MALLISLNLIGAFGCSWPWPLLPSSRAALRNSSLQQSDLRELLDKAKSAAQGREIVAIFSVRHPDGTLSDSALLAEAEGATPLAEAEGATPENHGTHNVAAVETPEAKLAAMKRERDQLVRLLGDKDARVVRLQRQIEAFERYLEKRDNSAVSSDTLAALERVAGPLPDNLVAVDLPPR